MRTFADLAQDLIRLEAAERWRKGPGVLRLFEEMSKHVDDPRRWEKLDEALVALGSGYAVIDLPLAELSIVPLVMMRQHAVGHGGFHTGVLGGVCPELRWVYDCGSLREAGKLRLTEEINRLADKGGGRLTLDFLFLSHFDRDHINGLEELMATVDVRRVVMPYLDDLQRLGVLVEAVAAEAAGGSSGPAIEAIMSNLADPVGWLERLGADQVVQVPAGGEGCRIFRSDSLDDGDVEDAGVFFYPQRGRRSANRQPAVVAPGSGWVASNHLGSPSDWCFVPYVTPATPGAIAALEETMQALLERDSARETWVQAFFRKLGEDGFIAKVKAAYKEHELGDANAVSMSLYAGPYRDAHGLGLSRQALPAWDPYFRSAVGWLLTGDAKLAQLGRRTDWLNFFSPVQGRIGTLMLPHHGSHLNFHEDLLEAMADDGLAFACRRDRRGDPLHERVWPHVENRRNQIITEDPHTALQQVSGPSVLSSAGPELRRLAKEWR